MGFPFDLKGRFESFIEEFADQEGQLRYQEKIREMETTGARSLYISYNDLLIQDPKLAREILVNPEVSLAAGEEVLRSKIAEISPGYLERLKQVHVRITDLSEKLLLRSLKTEHLGILTCFKGIVIGVTDTKPLLIRGHFKCASCGDDNQIIDFPEGIYTPPYQCRNEQCQRKGSLHLQLDKSVFIDWQKITLQEKPEELPPGQLPQNTYIHILDDLVDHARPGDRVEIVGILKARASRFLKRGQLATYGKFFHGSSIAKETEEYVDIEISDEDELKIIDLSKSPYIIEKIRDSLAPSIYGHDLVKEAIASLLFGGTTKETPDGMKLRGESNILIVGDPGTGKSIHGSESIYVGFQSPTGFKWDCEKIGPFIDNLMDTSYNDIITTGETEVLRLEEGVEAYTASLNPNTLKTQKSRIIEVSRHQAKDLVRIRTRSGRNILATPDHSFSTLVNGQLEVIRAADLNEDSYVPIARNIQINESEIISSIDFRKVFFANDLVRAEVIRDQIIRIHENESNVLTAAKIANVTPGTFRKYMNDMTSFPKDNWLRRKYDTSWFPSNVELNKEFGRIIGFYLAEGNTEKVAIRFSNTDGEIIDQINADLQKIFGKSCLIDNGIMLNQSSINQWFKETFGSGAGNKKLPSIFIATPIGFRRAILSAYFTGDGWIEEKSAAVSATTKSQSLAYSISDLLATLGIFSSVRTKIIKSGKYLGRVYYTITITGDELSSFYSQIGFLSSSKNQRLEKFVEKLSTRKRYQSRDIIPNFGSLLTDVARMLGLKGKRGTWERSFLGELRGKKHRQRVGRKYLQKVVKKFDELDREDGEIQTLEWLKTLASSDIYWDKILEIESVREPTTVYDIGTEEGHFIVANGNLVVHNSQILKFVTQLAPRALYTTGKGSTAAGLTAAVIRDQDTGEVTLEAGALVLADQGIAMVDEFDKMRPEDRSAIHEAMEQHTISIAKAGIVATLNARTSILAAANPRRGRWNPFKATADNLNLPPTILSRFDLIFVLEDKPDEKEDHDLASHILLLHKSQTLSTSPPIEQDLLRKYIAYARKEVHPRLSDEAAERLLEYYKELRRTSGMVEEGHLDPIAITPRQLESLVRLSEARAKMRLSTEVSYDDASGAVNLMNATLEKLAKDAETGKLDIDKYSSGISARSRRRLDQIDALIDRMFEEAEDEEPVAIKDIIDKAIEEGLNKNQVVKAIDEMTRRGVLFEPQQGYVKRP